MNILFIQTDQQRRDSLPCYGNTEVRAPHLQALAEQGVVFDNAFTTVPLCAPARASLLVGKRPIHHGILYNCESGCVAGRDFAQEQLGFGQLLRDRGYHCSHLGKWHIGTTLRPDECGFDGAFYPRYGFPKAHPRYLEHLRGLGLEDFECSCEKYGVYSDGRRGPRLSAIQAGGAEASVPHYLAGETIAAMKTAVAQDKPFFVACNFWGPHAPYILPEQYMRMYDPKAVTPPRTSYADLAHKPQLHSDYSRYWGVHNFTPQQWSELIAACYGYISLIDEQVGRMLACLDELGIADETTVIFTSDHGGMVGSHGLMDKGPFLYDDVCRVPMIVRPAGAARTARRDEHVVYNMDLMATFVELAGAAAGTDLDATSLVPLWTDREADFPSRPAAFCEYHGHQVPAFGRMIRTDRAKYVFNACGCDEFYDLDADPDERANLIEGPARRDEIAEMRMSLADYLAGQGDPALPFFRATRLSG